MAKEHGDGTGFAVPQDVPQSNLFEGMPTNEETILAGESQFAAVHNRLRGLEKQGGLPNGASDVFGRDLGLQALFIGLSPEVGSFHPTKIMVRPIFPTILSIMQEEAPNLLVVHHQPVNGRQDPIGIINIDAASLAIRKNQQDFPQKAKEDITTWLQEDVNEWFPAFVDADGNSQFDLTDRMKDIVHTRMGLLSGFPRDAALNYASFLRARNKFLGLLSAEEREFYQDYLQGFIPANEAQATIATLIDQPREDLSTRERQLLLTARRVEYAKGEISFIGFSDQDSEYGERAQKVSRGMEARIMAASLLPLFKPMLDKLPEWVREEYRKASQEEGVM